MSLLIEKNMRTSGPRLVPGDVKNVDIKSGVGKVSIKWTDPDDTTYENYTFIKWKGTILIRKKDSAPSNINDGVVLINSTIKNQYKDTAYEDNNLEDGNYYYRFFVYSEDNVYNDDESMTYNTNVVSADPILKNNSWETIIDIANKGQGQNYWKIGDEIDIKRTNGEIITFQIWDFNHFDKSDGTGKANICFGAKDLLNNNKSMNSSDTNRGGWNATSLKKNIMKACYDTMPDNIRPHIKEVNTYANNDHYVVSESIGLLSKDYIFIPGLSEIDNKFESQNKTERGQKKFPIFTDIYSACRFYRDASRNKDGHSYWTRSPYYDGSTFCTMHCYKMFGRDWCGEHNTDISFTNNGVCLVFNI